MSTRNVLTQTSTACTIPDMDKFAHNELQRFVDQSGSIAAAAKRVGVQPSAMGHWLNGRRRISPEMALRIQKESEGEITATSLVFGNAA